MAQLCSLRRYLASSGVSDNRGNVPMCNLIQKQNNILIDFAFWFNFTNVPNDNFFLWMGIWHTIIIDSDMQPVVQKKYLYKKYPGIRKQALPANSITCWGLFGLLWASVHFISPTKTTLYYILHLFQINNNNNNLGLYCCISPSNI